MPKKAKRTSTRYSGRGAKVHKTSVQPTERARATGVPLQEKTVAASPVSPRYSARGESERKWDSTTYAYVASDLKRAGMVSVLAVALLVVLAIVIE